MTNDHRTRCISTLKMGVEGGPSGGSRERYGVQGDTEDPFVGSLSKVTGSFHCFGVQKCSNSPFEAGF